MFKLLRKPKNMIAVAGALGVTAFVINDTQFKKRVTSSYRICNLLSTVALMSTDYAISMYLFRERNRNNSKQISYEIYEDELKRLQTLQEVYTINQIKAQDIEDSGVHWQNLIIKTRFEMDKIVYEMAQLSEENTNYTELHNRNAIRLRDMCLSNGGIYIKLGQHISMLDHIIPIEYQLILSSLLNKTTRSSYDSVKKVIKEELGSYPEDMFDQFDHEPIASASIAQVHICICKALVNDMRELQLRPGQLVACWSL